MQTQGQQGPGGRAHPSFGQAFPNGPLTLFMMFQYVSIMTEPEVEVLLEQVPEFALRYLALVEAADGDPGAAVAFEELADFTATILRLLDRAEPLFQRIMEGIEQVAASSDDAGELVGGAFLESLSPDDVRAAEQAMGPATRAILDELQLPPAARP
jgi:hypothetical protein